MKHIKNFQNHINEMKSNTSKLFNWSWGEFESAKEIQSRIREMSNDDLLSILNDVSPGELNIPKKLNSPRNIQIALLVKEVKRRGLKIDDLDSDNINDEV